MPEYRFSAQQYRPQSVHEISSFQSSSLPNSLTSFLSTFLLPLFVPCLSETRYVTGGECIEMKTEGMQQPWMEAWGGHSNRWREDHTSGYSELTESSMIQAPKHNGTSFAECQWLAHWNWDQQLTSHAAVLCCPNWWPVATCSYLNQN